VSPAEFVLTRLLDAGISVEVDGADLLLSPEESVTPELLAQVRASKPRLIAWLTWDEQAARDVLDTALDRIGHACTEVASFDADQRRADLEERINLAAQRRNMAAFLAALAEFEHHCLTAYRGPER
jgi:hypothetical protein